MIFWICPLVIPTNSSYPLSINPVESNLSTLFTPDVCPERPMAYTGVVLEGARTMEHASIPGLKI